MKIEESVNKLNGIIKDYQGMDKEMIYMETEDEDIEAIETIVATYKRLVQENLDLVDLYKRTANHLRKKGNEELALYFLAQINETPSFGTMDLYDNWMKRNEVEEAFKDVEDYFYRLNGPDEDIKYIREVKFKLLEGK